jgi:tRNA pseudouridine synthase 10
MLQKAQNLLLDKKLCDNCLGRQFALLGYGLTNARRGQILKEALVLALIEDTTIEKKRDILLSLANSGNLLAIQSLQRIGLIEENFDSSEFICELCEGIFTRLGLYKEEVIKKVMNEDFESFLLGAKFFPEIIEKEDDIRAKHQISTGESIKAEFTRELGKLIMHDMNKVPDFQNADLTIIIDLPKQEIIIEKRSLYIYGRYNKLIRTIPQTRWPCYDCNGKGCENCNFTGKRYIESIEELIAHPVMKITGGNGSRFHGAGREDIDALMLGNGRPFVLEIKEPDKRKVDLVKLEKKINRYAKKKVKVSELAFASKKTVQEIKRISEKSRKTYCANIELDQEIQLNQLKQLEEELTEKQIAQLTPTRVLHRRADMERPKMVHQVKIQQIDDKHIIAEIEGQGGLYIKELISGDNGRTKPSFSSILKCNAVCTKLDVIYLHDPDEN